MVWHETNEIVRNIMNEESDELDGKLAAQRAETENKIGLLFWIIGAVLAIILAFVVR